MAQKIASITYLVRDYDEAIAFFTTKMAFRLVEDTPMEGGKRWVVVSPPANKGGTNLLLAKATTIDQINAVGNQTGGRVAFFLHTTDFYADHQAMLANGIHFTEQPRHEVYGTVVVFTDLYGNKWDMVQPHPASAQPVSIPANSYITDILSQPAALQAALAAYPAAQLSELATRFQAGDFKKMVITGMGSSHNALYPAQLALASSPIPVQYINTAELLHYASSAIEPNTLLWINSQSGQSAELVNLLQNPTIARPAFQLTLSNQPASPVAARADLCIPLHAGHEQTVSTKTYLNTLALSMLAATQLSGGAWQPLRDEMLASLPLLTAFVGDFAQQVQQMATLTGTLQRAVLVGRGPSMASVMQGSLISSEAGKFQIPGLNTADFRHGPFEIVDQDLSVFILAGTPKTEAVNLGLAREVLQKQGKPVWLGTHPQQGIPSFVLPPVPARLLPFAEILALQALSVVLARQTGFEPGIFRHITKVTHTE